jgi:hypothetical protein
MRRALTLAGILSLGLGLALPADLVAQTKEDTVVYAILSDTPNWDPPNSVLRESIILGYHVFDHLAARDPKTGKVGPSLATSWRALDDHLGGEAPPGRQVPRREPLHRAGRQGVVRARPRSRQEDAAPRQPPEDQERRGGGRPDRPLQDRRRVPPSSSSG